MLPQRLLFPVGAAGVSSLALNSTLDCTDQDDAETLFLQLSMGVFIITGLLVSYLPQFRKIIVSKSSAGLSVWFLFLGSLGNMGLVTVATIQQANQIPLVSCFANTLGFTQIFVQFSCFHYLIFLYYAYYPYRPTSNGAAALPDPERQLNNRVLKLILAWLVVNAFLLVTSLVTRDALLVTVTTGVLGSIALGTTFVMYLPQLWKTIQDRSPGAVSIAMLAMQCPGNFILVYSLTLQPGTDWTTWVAFLASGIFQLILLSLCVFFLIRGPPADSFEEEAQPQRPAESADAERNATEQTPLLTSR
ncbi:hypothetical protein HDU96_011056 [Phlyctochytrium bullatum]|nr:hypothetical protein HDU96_011056 [Phlyctochytrium bullatum]